jgi:hypothetical protein
MKPLLSPAAMRAIAESADRIAALATDAAAIFRKLASDPALSPLSTNPEIDWLIDNHSTTVAQLQVECRVLIEQLTLLAKAARKAKRRERVTSIFIEK